MFSSVDCALTSCRHNCTNSAPVMISWSWLLSTDLKLAIEVENLALYVLHLQVDLCMLEIDKLDSRHLRWSPICREDSSEPGALVCFLAMCLMFVRIRPRTWRTPSESISSIFKHVWGSDCLTIVYVWAYVYTIISCCSFYMSAHAFAYSRRARLRYAVSCRFVAPWWLQWW